MFDAPAKAKQVIRELRPSDSLPAVIAAALDAAYAAGVVDAARVAEDVTTRRAREMGLVHYDHLTGHLAAAAIRALIPPAPQTRNTGSTADPPE